MANHLLLYVSVKEPTAQPGLPDSAPSVPVMITNRRTGATATVDQEPPLRYSPVTPPPVKPEPRPPLVVPQSTPTLQTPVQDQTTVFAVTAEVHEAETQTYKPTPVPAGSSTPPHRNVGPQADQPGLPG